MEYVKGEPKDIKKEEAYALANWSEHKAADGTPYFCNKVTNASNWDEPEAELMLSKPQWKEYKSEAGKVYYHRIKAESKRKPNCADRVPCESDFKKSKLNTTDVAPVSMKEEPTDTENIHKLSKLELEEEWVVCSACNVRLKHRNLSTHLGSKCTGGRSVRAREERERAREEQKQEREERKRARKEQKRAREERNREKIKKEKLEKEKQEACKVGVRHAQEAAARARQNLSQANPTVLRQYANFETESLDEILDEDMSGDMFSWSPPPSP